MTNRFTKITQIGMVIKDKERVLAKMEQVFGAAPSRRLFALEDDSRVYRGKKGEFSAELIFYDFANIELEFIVPLKGPSIWQDFLDAHGEGLHHIQFAVDSFEGARADMRSAGIEMMQEGGSATKVPNLKWGYFDTEGILPFIIEISNPGEATKS